MSRYRIASGFQTPYYVDKTSVVSQRKKFGRRRQMLAEQLQKQDEQSLTCGERQGKCDQDIETTSNGFEKSTIAINANCIDCNRKFYDGHEIAHFCREPEERESFQEPGTPSMNRNSNKHHGLRHLTARNTFFKSHLSNDEIRNGIDSGALFEGSIRISQRKYEDAFINNPDGNEFSDIAVLGMQDRNRALHGDIVAFRIKPRIKWIVLENEYQQWKEEGHHGKTKQSVNVEVSKFEKADSVIDFEKKSGRNLSCRILLELPLEEWILPDSCLQKTAEVVGILERKSSRLAVGRLQLPCTSKRRWVKFVPADIRMPRMIIGASQLPKGFFHRPQDFCQLIFIAKILKWDDDSIMAQGELQKQLGPAGDISAETEGLLLANGIDVREFSDEVTSCLPSVSSETGWKIDEVEIARRRDLRNEIVFTIDPKTARDLDDALSIKRCQNIDGLGAPGWEIGVHIADVSHFVLENTALDDWALSRATSVYLVDKVIPMLPRLLCENLCSLNAGVDRLTFSVIFKVDDKGNVFDEWFGRTVIRSRVQLAYEHAQDFIENPERDFLDFEVPAIFDHVTIDQIKEKVLQLHAVAHALRRRRSENGSLELDQPKLQFALDDETNTPIGVSVYQSKESNHLVEEFMLLTNMAVARKIERHFRKTALLRSHPPPKAKVLQNAMSTCKKIGFPVSGTSSQELATSLAQFRPNSLLSICIKQVLSMVLLKSMELARYFCTGTVDNRISYHHYALNVPMYTHFTSPIRRYPDIIVHRMLAAALNYCELSKRSTEELEIIARHCNNKKLIAKQVWDKSSEIFFSTLVQRAGPIETRGIVVNVLDASFDILLFKYGVVKRVYVKALQLHEDPIFERSSSTLTLFWQTDTGVMEQLIQLCTIVDVVMTGLPTTLKYDVVIKAKSTLESPTLSELWYDSGDPSVGKRALNIDSILMA